MTELKCPECGVGRCQPLTSPYIRWLGRQMVVLPNAPAAKCDVCSEINYDPRFLDAMQQLFDQLLEEKQRRIPRQQTVAEQPAAWAPARRGG